MNRDAKAAFVCALIQSIQTDILAKVASMPDHWDGHELRRYIAEKFEQSAMTVGRPGPHGKPYARRFREYRNEVLVRNL